VDHTSQHEDNTRRAEVCSGQGVTDEEALEKGMEDKSEELAEKKGDLRKGADRIEVQLRC
jgi:hypothetical protein